MRRIKTITKGISAKILKSRWKCYAQKKLNSIKSIIFYSGHTFRDVYCLQSTTIIKCFFFNFCNSNRDIYFFQPITILKSTFTNRSNTSMDVNVFQITTILVSIISWLSVLYALNGGKVTMWILCRHEKCEI